MVHDSWFMAHGLGHGRGVASRGAPHQLNPPVGAPPRGPPGPSPRTPLFAIGDEPGTMNHEPWTMNRMDESYTESATALDKLSTK